MEGAARVFAGDFREATFAVPDEGSESSAWVVTPGGAWCRSLYLCGALTEVTEVTDVLFCRLADPTGAFDLVTGGRRGAVAEQLRAIPVPSFVAVTGIAQLYKKNGSWAVSVRPEYIRVIDKATRNRWIVTAADMTLARIERLLALLDGDTGDARATRVIRHYGLTREQAPRHGHDNRWCAYQRKYQSRSTAGRRGRYQRSGDGDHLRRKRPPRSCRTGCNREGRFTGVHAGSGACRNRKPGNQR